MEENKLLSPKIDVVFQALFGEVGNEEVTKALLKVILKQKIEEVNLNQNPILRREFENDKLGILDILAKVNEKEKTEGTELVTLNEMIERVKRKDIFKEKHNASDCYDIADYVVDNSSNVTYDEFLKEIETIAYDTINKTNNSHSKKDSSKKMVLKK